MTARIEISIEANDANGIEDRIREIASFTFGWAWTNAGSTKEIAKHVERDGEYVDEDSGDGWTAAIAVDM